jgi:hypothetical protein
MSGKARPADFSERVSIRFKAGAPDEPYSELFTELVEFLNLKKAMGVHQQWIKNAVLEQFVRERGDVPGAPVTFGTAKQEKPERSVAAAPLVSDSPRPAVEKERSVPDRTILATPEPEIAETTFPQVQADQAGSSTSVQPAKVAPLPRSFANIMG